MKKFKEMVGGLEERQVQVWWLEHEAQEETNGGLCSQGGQSFHQGALRIQGQGCKEDCQGRANEEVQGNGEDCKSIWAAIFQNDRSSHKMFVVACLHFLQVSC